MSELDEIARGRGADARAARRTLRRRAASAAAGRDSAFDDFSPLTGALEDLASRLAPAERTKLTRAIAADLRTANARRLRANVEPEGGDMTPRKRKKSGRLRAKRMRDENSPSRSARKSVRQERMFQRAGEPRYLRRESTAGEARVGFVGAMARIMSVHQYGLRDTVTRDPNSPQVAYPVRVVIGMTADDRLRILDQVAGAIQP